MGWSYGDWSRIFIHDLSSSNLCSEQTLGAFQYKEWSAKWGNSEVFIFCMCHLASPRLADTDARCFLSLLYRICGFCKYLVMLIPISLVLDVIPKLFFYPKLVRN